MLFSQSYPLFCDQYLGLAPLKTEAERKMNFFSGSGIQELEAVNGVEKLGEPTERHMMELSGWLTAPSHKTFWEGSPAPSQMGDYLWEEEDTKGNIPSPSGLLFTKDSLSQ